MKPEIQRLYLAAPLKYIEFDGDPFSPQLSVLPDEESLYCFELNPAQMREFEPDEAAIIKGLVFCGKAGNAAGDYGEKIQPKGGLGRNIELPRGNYLS